MSQSFASADVATVRDARADDNDALVRLAASCPMEGDISLCIHREPDFFELSRLEGDPWRVGVVDGPDGVPVGCIGVSRRRLHFNGVPRDVAYIGDLKVDPDHRRRRIAVALALWAQRVAEELVGLDGLRISTVLAGNDPIDRGRDAMAAFGLGLHQAAVVRSHSIPLMGPRRTARFRVTVEHATDAEVPELVRLWEQVAPARAGTPVFDEQTMRAWIDQCPGLDISDYLIARRDGKVVGFLGLWDQHVLKQMRVMRYPRSIAALRPVFNAFAPVTRVPRLPGPGGEFRYRTVVNLCVPPAETVVLRALLAHANNWLRREGCSFVALGLDRADPLSGALRGLLAQPTDVNVMVDHLAKRETAPDLGGAPVHFEIATV
ncbi:GNAT family N-acetyltransferase [Nocardia sp. NBC_01499]|uniref:GNAT family N-acetyltransferase n=1 Tax=Nocardia sp. NBC_01499 TaxID=2903597 RepID=UPI003868E75E